ncbi:MAG TPA: hypothetical protein VKB39_11705, partial [Candidatus Baltobacteraceae bacterium]|nr:hypothetical protein [Candidatus Baltobacteraceae bacterium]
MRRGFGVVLIAAFALTLTLSRTVASAGPFDVPNYDFRSAVLMQVFGETTDPASTVAAAYGDRTSESPLRSMALRVADPGAKDGFTENLAATPTFTEMPQKSDADGYIDLAQSVRARVLNTAVLYAPP